MNVAVWSTADDRVLTGGNDGLLTIVDAHQGTKICVHDLQEVVRYAITYLVLPELIIELLCNVIIHTRWKV